MTDPPNFVRRRWISPVCLTGQSQLLRISLSSLLSLFGLAAAAVCVSAQQTAGVGVSLALEGDALVIKAVVADSPAGKQENVQVWMLRGREDQTVPVSAASALADRLKAASINVTFQIVTGGHEITDEMASLGKSWLDKVVRSGK